MKSIGFKLWSAMMIFVVIILLLLWLFQIVFLQQFYKGQLISELTKKSSNFVLQVEKSEKINYLTYNQGLKDELESFAFTNNLNLEIFDSGSNSLYKASNSSDEQAPGVFRRYKSEATTEALSDVKVQKTFTHPRFGNEFLLIGLPIHHENQVMGALIISVPLAPVDDTTVILKKQLLWITLILFAAAVIMAYILSKAFTKPILQIEKVAKKISSGNLKVRVENKSKDEIGQLAATINKMGQELHKTEQLRRDFIANVSHELRTPLSLIRGYAETLRDITGNIPEKREKQIGIIIDESQRLSGLVNDILNLSQLQAGAVKLEIKPFSIDRTIESILKRYEGISSENKIIINSAVSAGLKVNADEKRIEQVLFNLINNAFNNTKPGGRIEVKAWDKEGYVKIEVRDTGTGISEELLEHIWDRYYRGDRTENKNVIGTGIGLAIVKNLLEAHSAKYGIESQVGEGTTFWFELKKYT